MNQSTIKNKMILCFLGLILLVMTVVTGVNLATHEFLIAQAISTAIALASGILLGSLFSKSIVQRLNKLSQAAKHVGRGDLTHDIEVLSKDEIRGLEEIFAMMLQQIRAMIVDIRQVSEQVSSANNSLMDITRRMIESTQQIDKASSDIAAGSKTQTLIVQETSVTVETNVKAMDRITQQSIQTISKIRDAITKTHSGGIHAKETLEHLQAVMNQIREYAAPIASLTGKVEKIRGIIGVMENIAQKTDLLALNASIEATRAGETGKGFALVADEIRGMADSSKQSSARISSLIEEILEDNEVVAKLLENNQRDVNRGTRIIHGIVQTFEEMLAGVKEIFQEVQGMERVTSEQLGKMEGLTEHFQKLYKIARKNFVSTQKTTVDIKKQKGEVAKILGAVKKLSKLSDKMLEKQSKFRLPKVM
jgi:methyl-accepting chemotaxis protein